MIDWHCHILPGLDDGSIDISDSIIMATRLMEFGFDTICCTPHCLKGYYEYSAQAVREATLMLQADLDNSDIQLNLWPGMEYCLDECFAAFADDLLPLGNTRIILCEAPQQANADVVQEGLELIIAQGYTPLIAHPERNELLSSILLQRSRMMDAELQKQREEGRKTRAADEGRFVEPDRSSQTQGFWKKLWPFSRNSASDDSSEKNGFRFGLPEQCLFQTNLGSYTAYYGVPNQMRAYNLLKTGIFTCLASDLHDSQSCSQVLDKEKLSTNPLLKKLSEWKGEVPLPKVVESVSPQMDLGL